MSRSCPTVCPRDCYDTCFALAELDESGEIARMRPDPTNPVTGQALCPRGARDGDRRVTNRVLYPHLGAAGDGSPRFERTDWDTAIERTANRLVETVTRHGPSSVLCLDYAGNTGLLSGAMPLRLWNVLGATRGDNTLCTASGAAGLALHYGAAYGLDPEDLPTRNLIVFWGFNPASSAPHLWTLARRAREAGAMIVVVDSRRSESARTADRWLAPRPGSDVALAYGVARVLFETGGVDLDFLSRHTVGQHELRREIELWTPDRVSEATGLAWTEVEALALAYRERRASATMIGIGFQKSDGGADAVRAVSLIPALVGLHRGFFYSNSSRGFVDGALVEGRSLVSRPAPLVSQVALARRVAAGEFRFIWVINMNPASSLPEAALFRQGLARSDVFVAVCDTHWSETARLADVVLPAASYLEKDDLVIPWTHRWVRWAPRVVTPLGESRDEVWIMQRLARAAAAATPESPWLFDEPWAVLEKALEGAFDGGSVADLRAGTPLKLRVRPPDHYPTPSGLIELAASRLDRPGATPLPRCQPAKMAPGELVMLSSALPRYTHTQFQEVYGPLPATVTIHPDDARSRSIAEGSQVALANRHGRVVLAARISTDVPPGVIWAPKLTSGQGGVPLNALVPGEPQELGGGSRYNSTRVALSPLE
ncbi:MAG: molybdopterin-dependent oxidoreductase [Candidatus Riflebacteria bacterium]|nr:molybdopterin-dependent oxidoreductase [Candidatus Riflebacteria bacterium]